MRIKEIIDFFTIEKDFSLDRVIENLNKSAYKVLFVTENRKLIGTITDGDIRRYVYNKKNNISETKAFDVMCKNFRYVSEENYKIFTTKDYLKYNVEYLPVLNNKMEIIKVIRIPVNFQKLLELKTKVLIMAGGKGTRLYPLTKIIPKALVPYKGKTIIEKIMEKFLNSGFDDFILSVNYKKRLIKEYFSELNYNISYIEEKDFLGTAGSIYLLKKYKISNPFFVTNCDTILDIDYSEALEYHIKEKADITIISSKEEINVAYGVIKCDSNSNYISIEEKPNFDLYINTGTYILNPTIISLISKDEKIDMPELIKRANGKKIKIYKTDKKIIDIGQWKYYKKIL